MCVCDSELNIEAGGWTRALSGHHPFYLLTVVESASNGVAGGDDSTFEDSQPFPPPPPPTEISLLEVPPKTPPSAEGFHVNELEIWPSVSAAPPSLPPTQVPVEAAQRVNGTFQNGQSSMLPTKEDTVPGKDSPPLPPPPPPPIKASTIPSSPGPAKEGPPLPIKPKPKL